MNTFEKKNLFRNVRTFLKKKVYIPLVGTGPPKQVTSLLADTKNDVMNEFRESNELRDLVTTSRCYIIGK